MRTLLTIVLTLCDFSLHHVASANESVNKAAVREIKLKELRIKPSRPFQKPVVITSLNELAQGLDMCLKEQLRMSWRSTWISSTSRFSSSLGPAPARTSLRSKSRNAR